MKRRFFSELQHATYDAAVHRPRDAANARAEVAVGPGQDLLQRDEALHDDMEGAARNEVNHFKGNHAPGKQRLWGMRRPPVFHGYLRTASATNAPTSIRADVHYCAPTIAEETAKLRARIDEFVGPLDDNADERLVRPACQKVALLFDQCADGGRSDPLSEKLLKRVCG